MGLLRFAWRHVIADSTRSLVTFLALVIAVTSFVLLSASASTQRLTVHDTLAANWRGPYDILVRSPSAVTELETTDQLIAPNFLSGAYGGITLEQWHEIQELPGVEIAAPIATVGMVPILTFNRVDVTEALPPGVERVLLRRESIDTARNGLLQFENVFGYVYLTRGELIFRPELAQQMKHTQEVIDGEIVYPCPDSEGVRAPTRAGTEIPQCLGQTSTLFDFQAVDGRFLMIVSIMTYPTVVAAIDPVSEAALLGLDGAIIDGRYLTELDSVDSTPLRDDRNRLVSPRVPMLMASNLGQADFQTSIEAEIMPESALDIWLASSHEDPSKRSLLMDSIPAASKLDIESITATELWARYLEDHPTQTALDTIETANATTWDDSYLIQGQVQYSISDDGILHAIQTKQPNDWVTRALPNTIQDSAYRTLDRIELGWRGDCPDCTSWLNLVPVGRFDPALIEGNESEVAALPLETYQLPVVNAADADTAAVLGSDNFLPDLSPTAVWQQPPGILISLNSLGIYDDTPLQRDDPISAIRVRVADVTGMDELSRERIRVVAEQIAATTGLRVDITVGSSQTGQLVVIPESELGVPELRLMEWWTRKGVSLEISEALDVKSLFLFGLILASCALTVGVSVGAAVRARNRELALLATIGWPASRLVSAVLIEVGLIGLAGGVVGAAIALPLSVLAGMTFQPGRALLAIPVALSVALMAALPATIRVSRLTPASALTPIKAKARHSKLKVRGPISLASAQLSRRPLRWLAGAFAVALPVAALSLLLGIITGFKGQVVGTRLGDAVTLNVRQPDLIASGMLGILGLAAVGMVIWLSTLEDGNDYAVLRTIGWTDRRLAVVTATQASLIALTGTVLGLVIAVSVIAPWFPQVLPAMIVPGALIVSGTLLACLVIAMALANWQQRKEIRELLQPAL